MAAANRIQAARHRGDEDDVTDSAASLERPEPSEDGGDDKAGHAEKKDKGPDDKDDADGVRIDFQNVWFRYPTRDAPVLNGLDLTVRCSRCRVQHSFPLFVAGQTVADNSPSHF